MKAHFPPYKSPETMFPHPGIDEHFLVLCAQFEHRALGTRRYRNAAMLLDKVEIEPTWRECRWDKGKLKSCGYPEYRIELRDVRAWCLLPPKSAPD